MFGFVQRHVFASFGLAIGAVWAVWGLAAQAREMWTAGLPPTDFAAIGALIFMLFVVFLLARFDQERHAPSSTPAPMRMPKISWPRPKETTGGLIVPPPTVTQTPPLRLSQEESERRIRAVDEMYEVLNLQAAGVISAGQQLSGQMRDLIFRDAKDTQLGLGVWRGQVLDLMKAMHGVQHRHSAHEDVYPKSLFEFSEFKPRLWKAQDELSGDIGLLLLLPGPMSRNHVLLLEHRIGPFEKSVNVLAEWTEARKQELRAIRQALIKAAP